MLLSTSFSNHPFTKPPLTPELPRKGLKSCFKRYSGTENSTTQMQPIMAVDEYKLNQHSLSSKQSKDRSPVYNTSHFSCNECLEMFAERQISHFSCKENALFNDRNKDSNCEKNSSDKINIDFSSTEDHFSDAHQTIDHISATLLCILKQDRKFCRKHCSDVAKHGIGMNNREHRSCCQLYDGGKEPRGENREVLKNSKRARNSIIPRIEIIDDSANEKCNNATVLGAATCGNGLNESRLGTYETYVSLPCSPITSPPSDRRRPFSASDLLSKSTGNRLLDRRSTLGTTKILPKTFDQWLLEKSRERRRSSSADVATNSERQKMKELKMRERLVHEKTFDEWKREKSEEEKLKREKQKKTENEKRKQKLEHAESHEKLSERIYNEWLMKKFNQELSVEMKLLQQLRGRRDKRGTNFPSITERATTE